MPPPFMLPGAVLSVTVELVSIRVPRFTIAPPDAPPVPLAIVSSSKVRVAPEFTASA